MNGCSMNPRRLSLASTFLLSVCFAVASIALKAGAQSGGSERAFPQSKAILEHALKEIQSAEAGRLPVLTGFAASTDHPLDRYQRGYYQSKIQVSSTPSGGSVVRVNVQLTAWYNDPMGTHSGYQVLNSNGRLEEDLLDQLAERLAAKSPQTAATSSAPPDAAPATQTSIPASATPTAAESTPPQPESTISAPVPRFPESGNLTSSLAEALSHAPKSPSEEQKNKATLQQTKGLEAEAKTLEELLHNQAHPDNLVAVKKSGTPVVESASLNAKTLFLASAHDEFEMLDFNSDWVHIRISGLSRGWIWRNNLEMPSGIPDSDLPVDKSAGPVASDLFHVAREEKALFPGDWSPLRGKMVKIVSVERLNEEKQEAGPQLRLEFAKSLFDKGYNELAQKSQELGGIVLIFDSADGGMIAATLPTLQQWKAGTLSDSALWHQCFFDPPESFAASGSSGSP